MNLITVSSGVWRNDVNLPFPQRVALGLVLLIAANLSAATHPAQAAEAQVPFPAQRLGLVVGASSLIGEKVMNENDRALGKLDDLILNLGRGQVVVAMVASGGNMQTPVPPGRFTIAAKGRVESDADKKLFESAPRVSRAGSPSSLNATTLSRTFQHFGQAAPEMPATGSTGFISSVTLRGARLLSDANEPLGQILDVMVDLPTGRIVYLVVEPGVPPDPHSALYLVPPAALRPAPAGGTLVLNADRSHFVAGFSFQRQFPTDACLSETALAVYKHYGLQIAAPSNPGPTGQDLMSRDGNPTASTAQGVPSAADEAISKAIWDEIVRKANGIIVLSIKITTVNGRVTMTGKVKDEAQERLIISAAERIAGAGHVDNQLQVRGKAKTAQL